MRIQKKVSYQENDQVLKKTAEKSPSLIDMKTSQVFSAFLNGLSVERNDCSSSYVGGDGGGGLKGGGSGGDW